MNLQKIKKEIDEVGFSIVENIISKDEVGILRSKLHTAVEEDAKEYGHLAGKQFNYIVDLTTHGPSFVKLLENEKILDIFSYFLGDDCILYSYNSAICLPNDKHEASNIHRTSIKFPYIEGYYFGLLMYLALNDFTDENGVTYYLPGSHKYEKMPSEEEFYRDAVQAIVKAGDAVFFHPLCLQVGDINNTDKTSYAISPFACRAFLKQRLDFPRMVTPEILSWLGKRGRAFLGFDSRVPTNLFEYYLPADKRLYKMKTT